MTYRENKVNPLGGGGGTPRQTLTEVDAALYGRVELPASGRVVARPTPLDKITIDLTQPRSIIPRGLQIRWDGSPDKIPALVDMWSRMCQERLSKDERFDWQAILRGEDYIDLDIDKQPSEVKLFIKIVNLALSIRDEGLNLPATISKQGDGWLLHTGGRRTMAYHLLKMALGKEWANIPAIERDYDVWAQISENNQRESHNAIGQARSLAKLIMDMYRDEMDFKPYHEMVTDAGCDRPYYAQASELEIKHGMGERVMNTLNASSRGRVSHYRELLRLSDEVWMLGDDRDLTEWYLRHIQKLPEDMQAKAIRHEWKSKDIEDWLESQTAHKEQKVFTTVNTLEDEAAQDAAQDAAREFAPVGRGGVPAPLNPNDAAMIRTGGMQVAAFSPYDKGGRWVEGAAVVVINAVRPVKWENNALREDFMQQVIQPGTLVGYVRSARTGSMEFVDVVVLPNGNIVKLRQGDVQLVDAPKVSAPEVAAVVPGGGDGGVPMAGGTNSDKMTPPETEDKEYSAKPYLGGHTELFALLSLLYSHSGHQPYAWLARMTDVELADYVERFGLKALEETFSGISNQTAEQFNRIHEELAHHLERLYTEAEDLKG